VLRTTFRPPCHRRRTLQCLQQFVRRCPRPWPQMIPRQTSAPSRLFGGPPCLQSYRCRMRPSYPGCRQESSNRYQNCRQASARYERSMSTVQDLALFAEDPKTDETDSPETEHTSCLPAIGRSPAAGHSSPKTRGRRASGNSPAGAAFGKGPRQALAHLPSHSVKQLHSRSARRKVALDLFIPAGANPDRRSRRPARFAPRPAVPQWRVESG
jgi:hypothetical protein